MGHHTWDRRSWTVTTTGGEPFVIQTDGGATWALRALIAAGPKGLHPTDGASGRFATLVGKLRDLGVSVEGLPLGDESGRPGFRLDCHVASS